MTDVLIETPSLNAAISYANEVISIGFSPSIQRAFNQWEAVSLRLCAVRWRTIPVPWIADYPLLYLTFIK